MSLLHITSPSHLDGFSSIPYKEAPIALAESPSIADIFKKTGLTKSVISKPHVPLKSRTKNLFAHLKYQTIPPELKNKIHQPPTDEVVQEFLTWYNTAFPSSPFDGNNLNVIQQAALFLREIASKTQRKEERENQVRDFSQHIGELNGIDPEIISVAFDALVFIDTNSDAFTHYEDALVHLHPFYLLKQSDLELFKNTYPVKYAQFEQTLFSFLNGLCDRTQFMQNIPKEEFVEWFNSLGLSDEILYPKNETTSYVAGQFLCYMAAQILEDRNQFIFAHEVGHIYDYHIGDDPWRKWKSVFGTALLILIGLCIVVFQPHLMILGFAVLVLCVLLSCRIGYAHWAHKYNMEIRADHIAVRTLKNGEGGAKWFEFDAKCRKIPQKEIHSHFVKDHLPDKQRADFLRKEHEKVTNIRQTLIEAIE